MKLRNSINTPDITPIKYKVNKIFKLAFLSLFTLNKTSKATPLPVSKPDTHDANDITPLKYNSVIITLAPQLGISPIKLDIKGAKILSETLLAKTEIGDIKTNNKKT